MRQDRTELRTEILKVIESKGPVTFGDIRRALNLEMADTGAIHTCLQTLQHNGLIEAHGRTIGYSSNSIGAKKPEQTEPVVLGPPLRAPKAVLTPTAQVEISKATLKVLVHSIIEGEIPLEGPLNKAMFCAMKKLI